MKSFPINDFIKDLLSDVHLLIFGKRGNYKKLRSKTVLISKSRFQSLNFSEISRKIDEIIEGNQDNVWQDSSKSDSRIFEFEKYMPNIVKELMIEKEIKEAQCYLGSRVRSWTILANRLTPTEGNLGSGGGVHRDSSFRHQVKCIWYLNDVVETNGPFQYIPESNFRTLRSAKEIGYKSRLQDNVGEFISVTGQAGTKIVCDTKGIHRGKPIESGYRYALTLYMFPNSNGVEDLLRKINVYP